MCHAFTSTPCVCSPAARRGLVGLFEHQSPFDSPLQLPVPSVSPAADAPAPCVTHAAGPLGASLQEAADTPSHSSCPLPSFTTASCLCNFLSLSLPLAFLLMSIPLNIVVTHLTKKTGRTGTWSCTGQKETFQHYSGNSAFSTHIAHTPPHHQTPRPPPPRCRPTRCRAAPSGRAWSASTAPSWCRRCRGRRWGGRGCGLQRSGGWGPLLYSAAVWPGWDSAGPRPGAGHCDRYAVPIGRGGHDFMSKKTKRGLVQILTVIQYPVSVSHIDTVCVVNFTFALMSAPRSTMFSTSDRKPWTEARWRQFWPANQKKKKKHQWKSLTTDPRPAYAILYLQLSRKSQRIGLKLIKI